MKKQFTVLKTGFIILVFIICPYVYAQGPSIGSGFPIVAPSSPSVSGLMKFEEIPVNNYTGVPDISIPLFSVQTRSKDITLNLSLNYHPASIAVNEVASSVGLGWSLFAGGTISRMVRGLPDEINKTTEPKKIGIYYNDYEQVNGIRDGVNNIDAPNSPIAEQFLWETVEKGMLDTEYDLYQYNFMGYSGRFYKKSNGAVIKLDNNNALDIKFASNVFTITDDKGYKYVFDVTETTNLNTLTTTKYFEGVADAMYPGSQSIIDYISAYHLSKIEDNTSIASAKRLATFNYFGTVIEETVLEDTETTNRILNPSSLSVLKSLISNNGCGGGQPLTYFEPEIVKNKQIRVTKTKKLQSILVPDKAKIIFKMQSGRQDRTFKSSIPISNFRLSQVIITDWQDNQIKKYDLFHSYSEIKTGNNRMMLERVTENDTQSYSLTYNGSAAANPNSTAIGVDHWGFYNLRPSNKAGGIYRETSSQMCIADALNSMTLPTGGTVEFEFESNEYSYDGEIRLEDFTENPDRFREASNLIELTERRKIPTSNCQSGQPVNCPFIKIQDKQTVRFVAQYDPEQSNNWGMFLCDIPYANSFNNPTSNGEVWSICQGEHCTPTPGYNPNLCPVEVELEPGWYYAFMDGWDMNMNNGGLHFFVSANYLERHPVNYYRQYLIGGGVRIKSISYYDGTKSLGKRTYNYNFFNENTRSSGSLAFPKPVYKYPMSARHKLRQGNPCNLLTYEFAMQQIAYESTTTFDNLKSINTQGAYVGYKNVSVSQTGYIPGGNSEIIETKNGKSEYTYSSPIDEPIRDSEYSIDYNATPNPKYSIPYPYHAPLNLDYKRGILKQERYYDEWDKLLSEVIYNPTMVEGFEQTGIRPFTIVNCPFGRDFINYTAYMTNFGNCQVSSSPTVCYNCGDPSGYIFAKDVKDAFGWIKSMEKTSKNYFYDKNNFQDVVEIKETSVYDDTNKKIINYKKQTYNKNGTTPEQIEEQYTYFFNPTVSAQNDISKIWRVASFANNEQVSNQMITYSNTLSSNNPDYLPQKIGVAKGTGTPENRLSFNNYDIFGNPREIKKENGITVTYIYDYGYNTLIAMIENATYAQVTAALGAPVVSTGYSEADMVKLNDLRNTFRDANVTTYTYKPLVGVSSITDPRGQKTTYFYDNFGRLIQVKDHNNNIISENVYKYRNQN